MSKTICISGGIGSGKSVVCHALRAMGHPVYDTDTEARRIMDADPAIARLIAERISPECIKADGSIHRPTLASIVFADAEKLETLNSIVHAAVRRDLASWIERHFGRGTAFVETAILYQSGLDRMVDEVWEVTAPEETRIERVMARNSLSREQVVARIHSQRLPEGTSLHPRTLEITNDNLTPLLPQIEHLLGS